MILYILTIIFTSKCDRLRHKIGSIKKAYGNQNINYIIVYEINTITLKFMYNFQNDPCLEKTCVYLINEIKKNADCSSSNTLSIGLYYIL